MPQFGGTRRIRQACINRQCQHKSMKYRKDETQPSIKNIFKNIKCEEDVQNVKAESAYSKYEYRYVDTDEDIKNLEFEYEETDEDIKNLELEYEETYEDIKNLE